MVATSFGALGIEGNARLRAQQWLRENDYVPSVMEVGSRLLMWMGAFISMIHSDDHPADDFAAV